MADDLVIHFRGLCAYLLYDKDSSGDETKAAVLLLNESMHMPRLTVQLADLANDGDVAKFPNNNGVFGWLDLPYGCDVSVVPAGKTKGLPLKMKSPNGSRKGCPRSNKHDLAWLPDLNVLGGKGTLPELLNKPPDPFPAKLVVGRFFLTDGDLQCGGHAVDRKVIQKYQFPGRDPAALASVVDYSLDKVGKSVTLHGESGSSTLFDIPLMPPAEVLITHLPDPSHPYPAHFQVFYTLLQSGAATPVPVPAGPCPPQAPDDVKNEPRRPCPQAALRLS